MPEEGGEIRRHPLDENLIVQYQKDNLVLITDDRTIQQYDVNVI